MKLRMAWFGLALMLVVGSGVRAEIKKLDSEKSHDMRVSTFCIEGHVFVVAISDVGEGGGTAVTQLYHEVNGKTVPMLCNQTMKARRARNEKKP